MWLACLIVRLITRIITLPFFPRLLKYDDRAQAAAQAQHVTVPDHLVESILLQLPVKTLLRFRRLSKQWNSTITSPAFATMHLENLQSPTSPSRRCSGAHAVCLDYSAQHRLFRSQRAYLYAARIPNNLAARVKRRVFIHPRMDTRAEYHSSCNGLVCMGRLSILKFRVRATLLIQVCNLATGKHKQVASLPASLLSEMSDRACVTMMRDIMLGFGYDSTVNDFKIVFMYRSSGETTYQIQLMSLKSNTWKSVDSDLSDVTCCAHSYSNTVSLAGNVYWTVQCDMWCMILKCILGEERFELMSFPDKEGKVHGSHDVGQCSRLTSHDGSLYIFIQKHLYVGKVDIWILSMGSEIWCRVATVTAPGDIMPLRYYYPLGFDCNGHVIMCVGVVDYFKLFAYLVKEMKFVELDSWNDCHYFHLVQVESLASP